MVKAMTTNHVIGINSSFIGYCASTLLHNFFTRIKIVTTKAVSAN